MITTTVTSTVTTVTTMGFLGTILGLVAIIALIALLCAKELASAQRSSLRQSLAKFLDTGIIPLIIVFAVTVSTHLIEILA